MPTFLFTHYFPANFQSSPETLAAAKNWFASLGASLPEPGSPAVDRGAAKGLGDCEITAERNLAYTLISSDDLDTAMTFARAWPLLARGGGVEVRELAVLTPSVHAAA
jgi:hypothetical protein